MDIQIKKSGSMWSQITAAENPKWDRPRPKQKRKHNSRIWWVDTMSNLNRSRVRKTIEVKPNKYPREMKSLSQSNTFTPMFISVLLAIAEIWSNLNIHQWRNG